MAKELDMKVVAEGIETDAEREVIASLDCDYGQGYLWSTAVPSLEFIDLISKKADPMIALAKPVPA